MINDQVPEVSPKSPANQNQVTWRPWLAVIFVILVYYASQVVGSLVVLIYPTLRHWNSAQAATWLQGSIIAQFIFIVSAEAFTVGAIYLFLRRARARFASIGLRRPRLSDLAHGLLAVPAYYLIYLLSLSLIHI